VSQQDFKKRFLPKARRVVIKIGSQILSSFNGIEEERIRGLVSDLAILHNQKKEVVVVSSGAVAAGMIRLGVRERPKTIPQKQAMAAVGQIKLMALYERLFSEFKKSVAQILLTHDDLSDRRRYLNAKHTLITLLESSIIPIVNENDTVAVEEMKFGDNDHLSSLVATLLEADLLVMLSDVNGVYDQDPRLYPKAQLIPLISSKIEAGEKAAASGIPTIIANGMEDGVLHRVFSAKEEVGTLILSETSRLANRKHWIAYKPWSL
jgi:glutamate 5-kinase